MGMLADVGQHLARHDAPHLVDGPVAGLVALQPPLDDRGHGPLVVDATPLGGALGGRIPAARHLAQDALGLGSGPARRSKASRSGRW